MKKVAVIIGVLVSIMVLGSCTDNTIQDLEEQKRIQLIDKENSINPGSSGGDNGVDDDEV
ncbi:hypothetical protein [Tenacibaculum sp. 190524A02b]|uniref:hypothetical protein n=1 Tax=Tenacibaculum vairaonense TaxID=3137860 RepID=UPI0031FB8E4A